MCSCSRKLFVTQRNPSNSHKGYLAISDKIRHPGLPDNTQQKGKVNFSFFRTNWMHAGFFFFFFFSFIAYLYSTPLESNTSPVRIANFTLRCLKLCCFPSLGIIFFLGTMCMQKIKFHHFTSTGDFRTLQFHDLSVIEKDRKHRKCLSQIWNVLLFYFSSFSNQRFSDVFTRHRKKPVK